MYVTTLGEMIDALEDFRKATDSAVSVGIRDYRGRTPYAFEVTYDTRADCVWITPVPMPAESEFAAREEKG